jgi:hypothetical protein
MQTKENEKRGIRDAPTLVTVRRALGLTKTYVLLTVFISALAIAVWGNVMYVGAGTGTNSTSNSTVSNTLASNAIPQNAALATNSLKAGSGLPLLALPLDVAPVLMLLTPVVLLFVYDKNNGVLEYLLSLGMTQRDIYMRYLKAALLLVCIFSLFFVPATLAYGYVVYGASAVEAILPIPLLAVPFALAVATFMVLAMMAFSSLQKTRAGSNQPLGLIVGWLGTAPGYLIALTLPFEAAIYADVVLAAVIAIIALVFLMSSEKLIRREKFLP